MDYHIKNKEELYSILEKANSGDSIFVPSIEHLGNSIFDISELLNEFNKKSVYLLISNSIELDFHNNTNYSKNTLDLLNGICDLQKNRVRKSIKKAREEGKIVGRKKLTVEDLPKSFTDNLNNFYSQKINKTEFSKLCNCSRPTLDKWLKCVSNVE